MTETEWERRKRRERERAEHVAAHGPACQICGTVPKRGGLHQDHDHKTDRTRGYLCHACNRRLWAGATARWLLLAFGYMLTEPDGTSRLPELYQAYVQILRGWVEENA